MAFGKWMASALLVLLLASTSVQAYLPGIVEKDYNDTERVAIKVNSLRSLSTVLPYNYYDLPFCKPPVLTNFEETLGQVLSGDRIQSSPYYANMRQDVKCRLLPCMDRVANMKQVFDNVDKLERFINEGYRGNMIIDNLPMYFNLSKNLIYNGRCTGDIPTEQRQLYARGYAIGVNRQCVGKTLVNNHIHFNIQYHEVSRTATGPDGRELPQYTVVGLTGVPYSIKHSEDGSSCNNDIFNPRDPEIVPLTTDDLRSKTPFYWSYSVSWTRNDNLRWSTRWDAYLSTSFADSSPEIHWLNISVSILMALAIASAAMFILQRTLHKDIARYNAVAADEDEQAEEVGWKLVHADVFRTPNKAHLLAGIIGNGAQLILMSGVCLVFALMGFISPAARGSLVFALLLLFVLMSFASGFVTGHLLKVFDKREWKWVAMSGAAFPNLVFLVFFVTNLFNWSAHATTAVPFTQFLTVFALWMIFAIPLTVLGGTFAFAQPTIEHPIKVGRLARDIPEQRWYHSAPFVYLVPPLLPLAAAVLELWFILNSLWLNMVYYVFGFLALVAIIWTIVVALTTLIVVYFQLSYENYNWWWSSIAIPGCYGLHVFLYCIYYYLTYLYIDTITGTVIFFAYMLILSIAYGLAAGTIGFVTSAIFIRKIYTSIKID